MLSRAKAFFFWLIGSIKLATFLAEDFLEWAFFENALIPRLLRKALRYTALGLVLTIVPQLALFAYYKYLGQEEAATRIKNRMRLPLVTIFKHTLNFLKKALIGVLTGTISFTLLVATSAAASFIWPDTEDDDDYDDDFSFKAFRATVIFGPILEEIVFRGVILNAIKYTYNALSSAITSLIAIFRPPTAPERVIHPIPEPDHENPPKSYVGIFGSSLLFSAAHRRAQMPYAFLGGVVDGVLYEEYQSLVPSTFEHMTNNCLFYSALYVVNRCKIF